MSDRKSTDPLAHRVHIVLLAGLIVSALFLVVGFGLLLAAPHSESANRATELGKLLSRAASGDGSSVLTLGLLILMLTPVLRVLVLAFGWLLDRNWTFAAVAFSVLVLLAASVALGTG